MVNVATGKYLKGQDRFLHVFRTETKKWWREELPPGSPTHEQVNYAFKAYALKDAAEKHDVLLWCDASIVPGRRPLEDVWRKIEKNGIWFPWTGFNNYQWTADSAYPILFAHQPGMDSARAVNRAVPHVATGAFGIDLRQSIGSAFLDEFLRLAKTNAFNGPWKNRAHLEAHGNPNTGRKPRVDYCGPADVEGHRHDQTAASVIAWRLGVEPTIPPDLFAYKEQATEATCLIADGIC